MMNRFACAAILLLGALMTAWGQPDPAHAQGVTTSAVAGRVTDQTGEPLAGVQIVVVNEATGAQRGVLTRTNGRFNLPGLRPGGPYRIEARRIGYTTEAVEGVSLALGESEELGFTLTEEAVALEGVQVTAERGLRLESGTGTLIDERTVENAPTLGRDLADYTRLTPQAYVENDDDDGPAISIAGQNNRYNSIFIDGAVSNDVFGLSAQGTNGGQTGSTPISLDAIEEFQIALSPFDVTQSGFTGGAINAITRSGTNEFHGSLYYQLRNEGLAGLTPTDDPDFDRQRLPDFTNTRYGFRLGGPIIQDKLFFFLNGEILRAETPRPFNESYVGASAGQLDEIRQILIEELDYDPGPFGDQASTLDDNKVLAKIDWNISSNHRLSARHSYSQADNIDQFGSGARSINFDNRAEVFPNTTNATAVELNSTFGNRFANKLILGYTTVRDDRDFAGTPFPTVNIDDGAGNIFLGAEPFSTANILNQDILTLTNNFNWFLGAHTLTIGTHNEFYSIANLFIPFNFGWYFYDSADDFLQSVRAVNDPSIDPADSFVLRGYSLVGDEFGDESENIGAFDAYQLGVYVQDEYDASDRLQLTAGLRLDIPQITTEPRFAPDVFETTLQAIQTGQELEFDENGNPIFVDIPGFDGYDLNGARPGETPDALAYLSPRFGFSYDVLGDERTQLRGGLGVFTGRVPFVWPGGMFLNNGANTGILANFGPNEFRPNPANGLTLSDYGRASPIPSGRLEIFEEEFRYPRVFRTSFGIDQRLPYGLIGTLEGQYTKTIDNIIVKNINLKPTNETLNGPDDRPIYAYAVNEDGEIDFNANLIDDRYTVIHRVGSTSEGYTYDISAQLRKEFGENLFGSLAYTFGDAFAVNDGTSSQINSIWAFNENVNTLNDLDLTRSDFSIGHRILGTLSYRREFLRNLATSISLVYIGESGRPFSYVIDNSNDMTGETEGGDVALFYVPTNANELEFVPITDGDGNVISTPEEQAAELEEFINGNDYLSSRRGQYAQRNGDRTPFESVIDLRLSQEVFGNFAGRRNTVELTLDVFNVTNLLNDEWGRRYFGISSFDVVNFEGFRDAENGDFTPQYTFRRPDVDSEDDIFANTIIQTGSTYSARWQMQLGVRYTF